MTDAPAICPTCCEAVPEDGDYEPFCSERCKMVDLGRWFRGEYVVAGEASFAFDPDLGEPDPPDSRMSEDVGGSPEPEA